MYVHREVVTDDQLKQMGQALWSALDLAAAFDQALAEAAPRILPVVIESDLPALLTLPWETLYHAPLGFLGRDKRVTLTRRLKMAVEPHAPLPKGPLKVLLFTALPDHLEDQGRLDTEAELENVLEALTPWVQSGRVTLDAPDDGRFATFQRLVAQGDYHLVFLSRPRPF